MPPRSQTILRLCEAHQISTVPLPHIAFNAFAYLALHDQAFASLRSSKSCPRYTQQSKPLPNFTLQHNAIATLCNTTPLPFDACLCRSAPCFSLATLCVSSLIRCFSKLLEAFHGVSLHCISVAKHCIPKPLLTLHCTTKLCHAVALPFNARPRVSMPSPVTAFACHFQTQPCPRT